MPYERLKERNKAIREEFKRLFTDPKKQKLKWVYSQIAPKYQLTEGAIIFIIRDLKDKIKNGKSSNK
jgi:hypothetical protein